MLEISFGTEKCHKILKLCHIRCFYGPNLTYEAKMQTDYTKRTYLYGVLRNKYEGTQFNTQPPGKI